MKTLTIVTSVLPPWNRKLRYLYDGKHWDYLGQMMAQLDNRLLRTTPEKCRFPSDLSYSVPPFSFPLRGMICNTELTIQILRLDYKPLHLPDHFQILNSLLLPHNLRVEFVKSVPKF